MVWRILSGLFGISFLVAGFNVASNAQESCARVTLAAAERRTIEYTCWSETEWGIRHEYALVDESGATITPPDRSIPGSAIAATAFAIGLTLLTFGLWPILRAVLLRGEGSEPEPEAPLAGTDGPKEMPWDRAARERAAAREAQREAAEGPRAPAGPEGPVSGDGGDGG